MAKRITRTDVVPLICGSSLFATAQSGPSATDGQQQPIRVELTTQAEPQPSWGKWVTLGGQLAWPVVALVAFSLFRKSLISFLDTVAKRATKFSLGALGIELPTMNEAQLSDDLLTFRTADPFMVVGSSAKRTLFDMFQQPRTFEFVSINLGRGDSWVTSRLYIFAEMLQRMKSLRCIVFVAPGPETESLFLGATTPEVLRWSLARLQPRLEVAYAQAYQQAMLPSPAIPQVLVKNERGAVDPQTAEEIVKNFTKVTRHYLEAELGQILWKETIRASETKKEAKALLRCTVHSTNCRKDKTKRRIRGTY